MANQEQTDGVVTQLPVAAKKRLPKRVATVPMVDPYHEFSITAWMNHPWELRQAILTSGDEAKSREAWNQVLVGHDLVDFDGEPYPPAGTDEFYDAVPQEVLIAIWQTIQANVGKLTPTNAGR